MASPLLWRLPARSPALRDEGRGEGQGEGEMILSTSTLILPHQGGESLLENWMPRSFLRGSSLDALFVSRQR